MATTVATMSLRSIARRSCHLRVSVPSRSPAPRSTMQLRLHSLSSSSTADANAAARAAAARELRAVADALEAGAASASPVPPSAEAGAAAAAKAAAAREALYARTERALDGALRALDPLLFTVSLAESHCHAIALQCANAWRLADHVGDGALPLDELAARAGVRAPYLRAVLHAVHTRGFFKLEAGAPDAADGGAAHEQLQQAQTETVSNNELSDLLRAEHPMGVHQGIAFIGEDGLRASASLQAAGRAVEGEGAGEGAGKCAYQLAYGTDLDYFSHVARPENRWREARMGAAMKELHCAIPNAFAAGFDWKRLGKGPLVDVGGGQGTTQLQLFPHTDSLNFILFDLPTTVEKAQEVLAEPARAGRVTFASGDFFQTDPAKSGIPTGQPYYLIRNVLHDWEDERAVRILLSVRAAMVSGSGTGSAVKPRLLVSDLSLGPASSFFSFSTSVQVLSLAGGMERTEDVYARLLAQAGFAVDKIHRLGSETIIEADVC